MEFFLTEMPNSFLGRIEGFVFFALFACAVFLLHQLHNREDRIMMKEAKENPKKTKK